MNMKTELDLQQFCDEDNHRYRIQTPWVLNGWKIATNGKVCVRIKTSEPDTPKGEDRFVNADSLGWKRIDAATNWQPIPEPADLFRTEMCVKDCPDCKEVEDEECSECDGGGTIVCDACGNEEDCDACDGEGYIEKADKCPTCKGSGSVPREPHVMEIGGQWFDMDFLNALRAFPNVQMSLADKMAFFRFDDGQAIVMAMNTHWDKIR